MLILYIDSLLFKKSLVRLPNRGRVSDYTMKISSEGPVIKEMIMLHFVKHTLNLQEVSLR